MEKEVKNQNEVRALEYVSCNVPVGDEHMCFESRVLIAGGGKRQGK